MAHCPYDKLGDMEPAFTAIRALDGLREPKPGIFYMKSDGFLHFHVDKEGRRWADVKTAPRGAWTTIPVSDRVTAAECRKFVRAVEKCHKAYKGG